MNIATRQAYLNLRSVRVHEDALDAGRTWYRTARREARRIARENDITLSCAAGIIAATSPRVQWSHNLNLARGIAAGQEVRGLGNSIRSAQRIRNGERPLAVMQGPKVRAFYRNIMGDESHVTLDVWALKAAGWTADRVPGKATRASITEAYVLLAAERGETPAMLQAAIWVAVRGRAA